MNTEKRIGMACFIGAAIGALLALQFNHHFWWLGILLGGLVGYVAYNFHEIPRTASRVWQSMPEKKMAQKALLTCCQAIVVIAVVAALFLTLGIAMSSYFNAVFLLQSFVDPSSKPIHSHLFYIGGSVWMLLFGVVCYITLKKEDIELECLGLIIMACAPILTPVIIVAIAMAIAALGVWLLCCWIPKTAWKLARATFLLVHSELRLLCMTDAMLGALVGYFCGNALIGGIAGAAFGVLNYRLVSVKLLKHAKA